MTAIRIFAATALLTLGLAACTDTGAANNPYAAGSTGQTVVPGTTSSVAGDAAATRNTQTSPATTGTGGGAGK